MRSEIRPAVLFSRFTSLAGAAVLAATALGDDCVVPPFRTLPVDSSHAAVGAEDVVTAAPYAFGLEKSGAGSWTLPLDRLLGRFAFPAAVRGGTLRVTDAGTSPVLSSAPAALQNAILWLDATRNTVTNGDGGVAIWHDVRESESEGVYGSSYPAAKAAAVGGAAIVYPTLEADAAGRQMVFFGGSVSANRTMDFVSAADRSVAYSAQNLRDVFLVIRFQNVFGWPLGNVAGKDPYFHNSLSTLGGAYLGIAASTATKSGVFCRNGVPFDPVNASVLKETQLLDWHSDWNRGVSVENFFNDRGYTPRQGGDYICEAAFFDKPLGEADRAKIREYLMRKWVGAAVATATLQASGAGELQLVGPQRAVTLAGDGTVSVETPDGWTFDAKDHPDFTGALRAPSGTLGLVTRTEGVAVPARSGETATLARDAFGNETLATAVGGDGRTMRVVSAASAATGTVRVTSVPATVTNLVVTGGTLALAAPRGRTGPTRPATETEPCAAVFANPDFETTTATACISSGEKYGWKAERTGSSGDLYFCNTGWMCDYKPPQGNWAMGLKLDAAGSSIAASTTVTVPAAGNYDLTFMTCARTGYALFATMTLVKDGVTNGLGGVICYPGDGYSRRRYRTPRLEAGTYTFVLKASVSQKRDSMGLFDDFKMTLSSEQDAARVVAVPNGDFELTEFPYHAKRDTVHYANTADGWTFAQGGTQGTDWTDNYPAVGIGTIGTTSAYYSEGTSPYGNTELCFWGTCGTATHAAFTSLPAGTWRLRCRASNWGASFCYPGVGNTRLSPTYRGTMNVIATVDGVERDLGSFEVPERRFSECLFPNALTVAAGQSVSLALRQTNGSGACVLVDDLAFVEAAAFETPAELVTDGGFETSDAWTLANNREPLGTASSEAGLWNYSWLPANFGYMCHAGTYALRLVDYGSAEQTVTFPEAGTYRLSFHARPRVEENYSDVDMTFLYGGNRVRATVTIGGEEREILTTPSLYTTNFVEYAALFTVPAATAGTLRLQGVNNATVKTNWRGSRTADLNVLVDGVSVRRETSDSLALDPNLTIRLDRTAKLHLDYVGTNRISELRFGFRRLAGVIDAKRHPNIVSGAGALYVEPQGFLTIVR